MNTKPLTFKDLVKMCKYFIKTTSTLFFKEFSLQNDVIFCRYKDFNFIARFPELPCALLTWEQYELTHWFLPNANGIVVDVGANVGGYTCRACRHAKLVIAIEPCPDVFKLLSLNAALNCSRGKVILINKAISNSQGKCLLKIPRKGSPYASLVNDETEGKGINVEVECDTLDEIISTIDIKRINLLKMDIEGAEAIAFKGMLNALEITDKLIMEIQPRNTWLIKELKKIGFRLVDRRHHNFFFVKY
jgi:FkbM family methyltransferase